MNEAFLITWLTFASVYSGLPITNDPLPVITLTDMRKGWRLGEGHCLGITEPDGSIFLHKGWRAESMYDQCILAHEFTHFLQFKNHYMATNFEDLEPLAYYVESICYDKMGDHKRALSAVKQGNRKGK